MEETGSVRMPGVSSGAEAAGGAEDGGSEAAAEVVTLPVLPFEEATTNLLRRDLQHALSRRHYDFSAADRYLSALQNHLPTFSHPSR